MLRVSSAKIGNPAVFLIAQDPYTPLELQNKTCDSPENIFLVKNRKWHNLF